MDRPHHFLSVSNSNNFLPPSPNTETFFALTVLLPCAALCFCSTIMSSKKGAFLCGEIWTDLHCPALENYGEGMLKGMQGERVEKLQHGAFWLSTDSKCLGWVWGWRMHEKQIKKKKKVTRAQAKTSPQIPGFLRDP